MLCFKMGPSCFELNLWPDIKEMDDTVSEEILYLLDILSWITKKIHVKNPC